MDFLTVRSYMAEMFNDALFYLQEAERETDTFVKTRFYRSSIINFCASAEAAMAFLAEKHLKAQNRSRLGRVDREILAYLNRVDKQPPQEFKSIPSKISKVTNYLKVEIPSQVREDYLALTSFRNRLIHYKTTLNNEIYLDGRLNKMAQNAPQITRSFLSHLSKDHNLGFYLNEKPNY
ncbi:hypothetical protein [Paenibacillus sp. J22TS3]|uniref:hypothetical protein n=1 Tax=Paenibacillus sp. J22TS3 TaxID=2807192 RepID=UPI001B1E94E1|nr:hypothetical protein [Paenibacillus sp. J22TS3]GIP21046.1 hypothetical protein J22TS3_13210 [Paenibacillus sp. J22TS3]